MLQVSQRRLLFSVGLIGIGNAFTLLAGGSLSGTFNSIQLPALSGPLQWDTSRLYTAGILAVILPGDYNNNGIVDAADYIVWRNTLGQSGTGLAADGNNNGIIDAGDFDVWRSHFGQTAGSGADISTNDAVPELATLELLMFATTCWYIRRVRTA
jgi:hypothetical protein